MNWIAIYSLFFCPYSKKGCLEQIDSSLNDQFFEEGQKECQKEISYVKNVIISVRGDNDASKAQILDIILDAKGHHEIVELSILIDRRSRALEHILWFTA